MPTIWTFTAPKKPIWRVSGFHAENVRIGNGEIFFDYISPLGNIDDIQLGVPIAINIENGVAAMALAQMSDVTNEEIKEGMRTFHGVDAV